MSTSARPWTGEGYPPIAEYAFLGDCHSAVLVSKSGSVDWACFRRFDASSVFGRLLDWTRGGFFSIAAVGDSHQTRRYLDNTLVLETHIETPSGSALLHEALTMTAGGADSPRHELVRRLRGVEGTVEFDITVAPRFDYGLTRPLLRRHDDFTFSAIGGCDALVVVADRGLGLDDNSYAIAGHVTVGSGDEFTIAMMSQPAHRVDPDALSLEGAGERLDGTVQWWTNWSQATTTRGPYAAICERSAIVLKALTCAPTGAVTAAATTSLPEAIGDSRNWDYRFSWVRDSSLVLDALAWAGHGEVAHGFRDFIMRSSAGHADDLQIMYGVYGERRLDEFELDLEGWRRSSPVRVGNGASGQTQLDVYAHLLDAVHVWHSNGQAIEPHEQTFLVEAADLICKRWHEPDHGIWELRGEPRHYVHSKASCWMGLDRAIRLAPLLGATDDVVKRWRQNGELIAAEIRDRGIDNERGCFVQHYDTDEVDASLLKLSLMGFVAPDDPAMRSTVAAIQSDLVDNPAGLVRRFRDTGTVREGAFLLCTFWMVENLALANRRDEAVMLFERAVGFGNDLGLFSEEADPDSGELLGNFPQAFTHLGVVQAARRLGEMSSDDDDSDRAVRGRSRR